MQGCVVFSFIHNYLIYIKVSYYFDLRQTAFSYKMFQSISKGENVSKIFFKYL